MLTTLKYEFMKNRVLYGISLGILAIVELVYLAIVPFRSIKDHTIVIPIFLLMIAGLFIFFMLLFNGITMFSRDLKSKAGYLVYMTPVPVPSILLAKILLVFLSSVIFGLGYLLLGIADFEILGSIAGDSSGDFARFIPEIFKMLRSSGAVPRIAGRFVRYAISVFDFLSITYFSIALGNTLLRGKKAGAMISFIVFVAIVILNSFITNMAGMSNLVASILHMVIGILCFLATSWMITKKIDL